MTQPKQSRATMGPMPRRRPCMAPLRLAVLGAALAGAGAAQAGDCTIGTSALAFGSYDPLAATPVDANGTVQVACTPNLFEVVFGVSVTVALGTGSSSTYASRTLRQGTMSTLSYNLYTTAARNTIWGNGTGGTQTRGAAIGGLLGEASPYSFVVYGRIPAGQDPGAGLHSDAVIVTVTF